ncbi:unnamed protein product [Porites evermanni]|uniref:Protein FAM227B n=1 Tax=Porites evermanni TaxID=104178 RepID=A0ABN8N9K2_9CNID|nr:unnamed protein product [Porites evermanni]
MDPRIQAILAQYEEEEQKEALKYKPKTPEPPKSFEQWLERRPTGFQEWPDSVEFDKDLSVSVASVGLGSLDDIIEDLGSHAPLGIGLIDEVNDDIQELEKKLQVYSSQVLTDKERPQTTVQTLSPANIKAISTEIPAEIINKKEKSVQKYGLGGEQASRMKSVQYTSYPGFFPNEVTPLPGQLEAPQLLNRVTKAQCFPSTFRKRWKKLFLSEGSVILLQDTFWWFFLERFQPDCKKAQNGLFSRIADSFVSLFFSVSPDFKDRFFQFFADCLAQAVYAAYCEVFPRSYQLFDDDFKNFLLNTISEWVTGTKPPPYSWEKWNLKLLEPRNIRELQDDRTQSLKANMSFDLDLVLDEYSLPVGKDRRGTFAGQYSPSRMGLTVIPSFDSTESHEIGPGPEFERVGFNLLGRSPLVTHFLKIRELMGKEQQPVQPVGRTEVAKLQPAAPTYRQVIKDCKKTTKTLNNHYQRVLDTSEQESLKIQKQKRAALAKLERLKNDLVLKNQDIKMINERLLDLMAQPDHATTGFPKSALEQSSDDET